MPDLVLRPGWNSQPPDGIDLSQELSGTSGPGFMILPSRLNPKGIVSACNLGYEYTQTHSSTQPRQTPSEYGTVLRLVADHGGGVDDRVRALNTQKTARVVPMTTIAVWKPITYSTGKTGFFIGAGHAGSCNSQSTGEFQFGYDAGNGYRRYAVFTAMMDRWNVAVISTRPVIGSEISASVNGRAPTSYTGSTAYVGDGPLSSDSKVELVDYEFTNYYHPNCEIAWLASLPGIYLSQAQCQQIALCPEDAFTFGFEPDDIYLWGTAGGGGGVTIDCNLGTATASGFQATVSSNVTIGASLGTATASGFQATVSSAVTVNCALGSASASGFQATVSSGQTINAALGVATASGFSATISANQTINASLGVASAIGYPADISVGGAATINCNLGTATASGFAATVSSPITIAANLGTAAAGGYQAVIAEILQANLGTAVASGYQAIIVGSDVVNCFIGTANAIGYQADIVETTISRTFGIARAYKQEFTKRSNIQTSRR